MDGEGTKTGRTSSAVSNESNRPKAPWDSTPKEIAALYPNEKYVHSLEMVEAADKGWTTRLDMHPELEKDLTPLGRTSLGLVMSMYDYLMRLDPTSPWLPTVAMQLGKHGVSISHRQEPVNTNDTTTKAHG